MEILDEIFDDLPESGSDSNGNTDTPNKHIVPDRFTDNIKITCD